MWALTLLAVLQAARANECVRISYATDENGAKTVSKSFAITARSPEACKKNQFSVAIVGVAIVILLLWLDYRGY